MKKEFLLIIICLAGIFTGCDKFRGKRGKPGISGLIGSKTYTGTPNDNPFTIACPEIKDLSKQVISVYATNGTEFVVLPMSTQIVHHVYEIDGNKITILTVYADGIWPSNALKNPPTGDDLQYDYRIDIKTFSAAPAKRLYLSTPEQELSMYDRLILGN